MMFWKTKRKEEPKEEGGEERLRKGLTKTRGSWLKRLGGMLGLRKLDEEQMEDLEEILISGDVGVKASMEILERIREDFKSGALEGAGLKEELKRHLGERMGDSVPDLRWNAEGPTCVLVVGVNGVGKTTSIAKFANHYRKRGKRVVLGAADTFRAAAIEQLEIWCGRIGVDCIRHQPGSDPAAVAFDAAQAAVSRKADLLVVDTAGRLHTAENLMKELGKISRVLGKGVPGAPHEVLLVVDATTGQNAVSQAKQFGAAVPLTGLILAKMDGTAKGGVAVAIHEETGLPVRFLGVGESLDDFVQFDPEMFVDALFEE